MLLQSIFSLPCGNNFNLASALALLCISINLVFAGNHSFSSPQPSTKHATTKHGLGPLTTKSITSSTATTSTGGSSTTTTAGTASTKSVSTHSPITSATVATSSSSMMPTGPQSDAKKILPTSPHPPSTTRKTSTVASTTTTTATTTTTTPKRTTSSKTEKSSTLPTTASDRKGHRNNATVKVHRRSANTATTASSNLSHVFNFTTASHSSSHPSPITIVRSGTATTSAPNATTTNNHSSSFNSTAPTTNHHSSLRTTTSRVPINSTGKGNHRNDSNSNSTSVESASSEHRSSKKPTKIRVGRSVGANDKIQPTLDHLNKKQKSVLTRDGAELEMCAQCDLDDAGNYCCSTQFCQRNSTSGQNTTFFGKVHHYFCQPAKDEHCSDAKPKSSPKHSDNDSSSYSKVAKAFNWTTGSSITAASKSPLEQNCSVWCDAEQKFCCPSGTFCSIDQSTKPSQYACYTSHGKEENKAHKVKMFEKQPSGNNGHSNHDNSDSSHHSHQHQSNEHQQQCAFYCDSQQKWCCPKQFSYCSWNNYYHQYYCYY